MIFNETWKKRRQMQILNVKVHHFSTREFEHSELIAKLKKNYLYRYAVW